MSAPLLAPIVAGLSLGLGWLAWPRGADAAYRLTRTRQAARPIAPSTTVSRGHPLVRRVAVVPLVLLAGVVVAGPVTGLVAGTGVAVGLAAITRRTPSPRARVDAVCLAVDLLAGCLDAGLSLSAGLSAAAQVGDPVVRQRFAEAGTRLAGGQPAEALYDDWAADPALRPVARSLRRTSVSGAAVAEELRRTASRLRAGQRAATRRRVQQVGVWIVVPLGLCFLPAFLAVAVVPLVLGLAPSLH